MMRNKRNGDPTLPKEVWVIAASVHREFSDSLLKLLTAHSAEATGPLGDALCELIAKHKQLAHGCDKAKEEIRKGRPRKKLEQEAPTNMLMRLLNKKSPGSQRKWTFKDERVIYEFVEQRRKDIASGNQSKPTVIGAIDSLNKEIALKLGLNSIDYVKKNRHVIKGLHARGKEQLKL